MKKNSLAKRILAVALVLAIVVELTPITFSKADEDSSVVTSTDELVEVQDENEEQLIVQTEDIDNQNDVQNNNTTNIGNGNGETITGDPAEEKHPEILGINDSYIFSSESDLITIDFTVNKVEEESTLGVELVNENSNSIYDLLKLYPTKEVSLDGTNGQIIIKKWIAKKADYKLIITEKYEDKIYVAEKTFSIIPKKIIRSEVDNTKPVVKLEQKDSRDLFYSDIQNSISIEVEAYDKIEEVTDHYFEPEDLNGVITEIFDKHYVSGLAYVAYSSNELKTIEDIEACKNKIIEFDNGKYTVELNNLTNETAFYFYAVDQVGNISEAAILQITKDDKAPTLDASKSEKIIVEEVDDEGLFNKAKHFFRRIFIQGDKYKVTVYVTDGKCGSGVASVKLYYKKDNNKKLDCTYNPECGSWEYVDYLKKDPDKDSFSVVATDRVGNESDDLDEVSIYSDATPPSIELKVAAEENKSDKQGDLLYFSHDFSFTASIDEPESGLQYYSVTIDEKIIEEGPEKKDVLEKSKTISLTESDINGFAINYPANEVHTIVVTAVNYTETRKNKDKNNNTTEVTEKFFKDTQAPTFDGFYIMGENDELAVTFKDANGYYKLFANEARRLYVKVKDKTANGEEGSGIESVEYALEGSDEYNPVLTEIVGRDTLYFIDLEPEFKGYIKFRATDKVGNVTKEDAVSSGIIIESEKHHGENAKITATCPKTEKADKAGNPLFNDKEPVEIKFAVSDTFAGIKNIKYSVKETRGTGCYGGELKVSEDGKYIFEDCNGMVSFSAGKTDKNLLTDINGVLKVDYNSNDIVINVEVEDNCGNKTELLPVEVKGEDGKITTKPLTISIDRTEPKAEIKWNELAGDSQYPTFYKADRVATITVTERNFDPSLFKLDITNTDGAIPTATEFTPAATNNLSDNDTYTATVTFSVDGDYTIACSHEDLAGNKGINFDKQEFTIDKTVPTVRVDFDNADARNGNYYKASRTATITVVEHNFDPNRVKIEGTATHNGATITFPSNSSWSNSGDTYTSTIKFDVDGTYSFKVSAVDKAGNESNEVTEAPFVIDLTLPEITISGVTDKTAYNGTIAPTVSITDDNLDANGVKISLVGSNRGPVDYAGAVSVTGNSYVFNYANFANEQVVDDIYTLTATETDKAGNEFTATVKFSVNRFGSVYAVDDEVKAIIGTYTNSPVDVSITETNIDELSMDSVQVVVTYNGTPVTLKEGSEFTVSRSSTSANWSQYTYTIKKDYFKQDGTYAVALYSVDGAGNKNQNTDESKKAAVSFGVDRTAPVIVPINVENDGKYKETVLNADISVNDNLVLDSVEISVNGEKVDYENNGEEYIVAIPESNTRQSIKVTAVDAAGNSVVYEAKNMLISTKFFVRLYNNTPLFAGVIILGCALIAGLTGLVTVKKRKAAK